MRCWNLWKAKSGLRSTFGIPPNTHPPHKRGILAFYRYIIKISTKCVWFCVRLSNTSQAYKNDDKELRPQKTEELVQIYTFCVSIPTTERRNWLPKMRGLYVCRGRILLLLYQGNCPFIQMPWRRSQGNWLFQALPIAAVIGADSYHESLLLEYRFWPMVWPCFHHNHSGFWITPQR